MSRAVAKLNNAQETNAEETLRAPVQESGSTETGEQDASGSGIMLKTKN